MAKKPVKPVVKPKPKVKPWDSAIPKDSIGQAVRGVIRGEVAPLEAQEQLGKATLAGNLKWYGDNNTAFQNAMRGLQSSSGTSANEMLRSAANRQVAHDREQNSALEFLRSTLRGDTGGPQRNLHLANDRLNTVRNVENRGLAGQIALNNQAHSGVLSGMRGVGHTSTVESRERARASYTDLMKQLALGKAQAIGKAPAVYRQYAMEQAAAQAALGDQAAKMQLEYAKLQNSRDIAGAKLAAGAAKDAARQGQIAAKDRGKFWKYGIGKQYDSELLRIQRATTNPKLAKPWRNTFKALNNIGLSSDQAAMLSTKWVGRRDKSSTPVGWVKMLRNNGVSTSVQKSVLKTLFGSGAYSKALRSMTATGGVGASAKNSSPTISGGIGGSVSGTSNVGWFS